jgi:hypothetical protein
MLMGYMVIAVIGGVMSVIAGLVVHLSVLYILALALLSANASVLGFALLRFALFKVRRKAGLLPRTLQQKAIEPF